jgi:hypothetical protein
MREMYWVLQVRMEKKEEEEDEDERWRCVAKK